MTLQYENTIISGGNLLEIHDSRISENYEVNNIILSKSELMNIVYPIGSIYMTDRATFNPNTSFGGSWEKIEEKFLLGSGAGYNCGNSGGEFEHTLVTDEIPSHSHKIIATSDGVVKTTDTFPVSERGFAASDRNVMASPPIRKWSDATNIATIGNIHLATFGKDVPTPLNIMPPYLVINIWKRVG